MRLDESPSVSSETLSLKPSCFFYKETGQSPTDCSLNLFLFVIKGNFELIKEAYLAQNTVWQAQQIT